jgi:lipid II:glycine glycyltransferase (peptidoglycan interpeptide bridge formation enzyme)
MKWKGFKDIRTTIEIDLKKSTEELWNSLDKDAKWGIKKAQKEGLKIKIANDEDNFKRFYECYKETCRYGRISPIKLEEVMKGQLFACFLGEKLIAGAVIKTEKEKIELFLNASSHEYLRYQPNNLLYWEIIIWGKNNNFKIFDLGGYQANARKEDKLYNINRFKLRWGGEIKIYPIYGKNLFYILGRKAIRNSRMLWRLNNWIRGR